MSGAGDFPADVVEVLEVLEGGGTLLPEEHEREPEEGAAFVARMDKLVARYEAQFLKKSQQQVSVFLFLMVSVASSPKRISAVLLKTAGCMQRPQSRLTVAKLTEGL